MKQNGTSWNSPLNGNHHNGSVLENEAELNGIFAGKDMRELDGIGSLTIDEIGDEHISTSYDTPLREDAFELSDGEKMDIIEGHFREIMLTLGLDLTDDSLKGP
ncbi:MAG: hypothetical protein MUF24_08550 [Chitinophagaceae bacterium]|nr:hypothetical protein [Chitinophagaceae bacterium]